MIKEWLKLSLGLLSPMLLSALAAFWCYQMYLIARYGQLACGEPNSTILYSEIVVLGSIAVIGGIEFLSRIRKVTEKGGDAIEGNMNSSEACHQAGDRSKSKEKGASK